MIRRIIEAEKSISPCPYFCEAEDGDTAVNLYRQNIAEGATFDLIFMDFIMVCCFCLLFFHFFCVFAVAFLFRTCRVKWYLINTGKNEWCYCIYGITERARIYRSYRGYEAICLLNSQSRLKRFDAVITGITGNAMPEDIATFLAAGATTVLVKPLTKSKLQDCIHDLIKTC